MFLKSIDYDKVMSMRITPIHLYRMGSSMPARMNNVREQDIEIFDRDGEWWVAANSGEISTFSIVGRGKNWRLQI